MSGKEQEEDTPIQNLAAKTVNAFHSTPYPPTPPGAQDQ